MDSMFYQFTSENRLTLAENDVLGGLPKVVIQYIAWLENKIPKGSDNTSHNKSMDAIKPCSRLADCACVRMEGACRGVSCGVYDPA